MSVSLILTVGDFGRSLRFYNDVLGFTTMRFAPERREAEVERESLAIGLVEGAEAIAPLDYPYGRGVTIVAWISDIEAAYSGVQAYGARLHRPLETVWHEEQGQRFGHDTFEVIDPDGYKLRFCQAKRPR